MTQETEIPADIALRANEVAVLIWDEAMSETPDGFGVHVDQKLVEGFVARAILAEREAATKLERERCAIIAEMHEHRGEIALAIRAGANP